MKKWLNINIINNESNINNEINDINANKLGNEINNINSNEKISEFLKKMWIIILSLKK